MTDKDTGGAAFPQSVAVGSAGDFVSSRDFKGDEGMSLRDYFAAKAMQAFIRPYAKHNGGIGVEHLNKNVAYLSYQMADAMLEARNK